MGQGVHAREELGLEHAGWLRRVDWVRGYLRTFTGSAAQAESPLVRKCPQIKTEDCSREQAKGDVLEALASAPHALEGDDGSAGVGDQSQKR